MNFSQSTTAQAHNSPLFRDSYYLSHWSFIPVAKNKKPAVQWAKFQQQRPTTEQAATWFKTFNNFGVITGQISNLFVLDFDSFDIYKKFNEALPHLTKTYTVTTRRGFHLYFIPAAHMPATTSATGLDLQANGRYVVATGSLIDNHRYTVNQRPPLEVNAEQTQQIESFIASLKPAPQTDEPTLTAGWVAADAHSYYQSIQHQGRNNALFQTALKARDAGRSCLATIEDLAPIHAANLWPGERSTAARHNEAVRTITSAYSRPPRRPDAPQVKASYLPTSIKQELNRRKLTAWIRVCQALRSSGVGIGEQFCYSDALEIMQTREMGVGDWSIRKAIHAQTDLGGIFPPAPPEHAARVATVQSLTENNNAYYLDGQNQQKPIRSIGGRPPIWYTMPDNAQIAAILGLKAAVSLDIDPHDLEALESAKTLRIALHRAFLVARPTNRGQSHRITFLARRLGVSIRTVKRYNLDLGYTSRPVYHETPLHYGNLLELERATDPTTEKPYGGFFLVDASGKRYPALLTIARHLLRRRVSVSLYQQKPSEWDYSRPHVTEQPAPVRIEQPTQTAAPVIEQPAPVRIEQPTQTAAPVIEQPAPVQATKPIVIKAENGPQRSYNYKRPLANTYAEKLAQSAHSAIPSLSLRNARAIVAHALDNSVSGAAIKRAIHVTVNRSTVRNQAGFFKTYVRSARYAVKTKDENAESDNIFSGLSWATFDKSKD